MSKYFRIPLYFLTIGSGLGVFLRWQLVLPTPGVNYSFFLHAHSHILFLGWIFNALYIGFVTTHAETKDDPFFIRLFLVLQIFVIGMLISFPLEGYAFFSILFSTLHTIGAILFVVRLVFKTKDVQKVSTRYAQIALIFFLVSTAGPFSLGYLMSNNMGHTNWYNFSIYFYLHFQYNGFFFFGILSLFFALLEKKKIHFNLRAAKTAAIILATSCIPAYILSILWAKPGQLLNIIGALTALIQCLGFGVLLKLIYENRFEIKQRFKPHSIVLLSVSLVGLALKIFLQTISASPVIALMAYELRPIVIAYLHLVLVGVISSFFFAWYFENDFVREASIKKVIPIFLISFIGMEICLILTPWWSSIVDLAVLHAPEYTFIFSILLFVSFFIFLFGSFIKRPDKSQDLT